MTTAEKTLANGPPPYSGRCVGSVYVCHLCRGPHYYSECPSFRGDLVCFYSELDANIYMMQHPCWEAATMGDVYSFLQTNLQSALCRPPDSLHTYLHQAAALPQAFLCASH